MECQFGCTGDDMAVHYGWFRCTPQSRAMLVEERAQLAEVNRVHDDDQGGDDRDGDGDHGDDQRGGVG